MIPLMLLIVVGAGVAGIAIVRTRQTRPSQIMPDDDEVYREPCDACSLVHVAIEEAHRREASRAVQILAGAAVATPIVADARRLVEVLARLIDHALELARPGDSISVTATRCNGAVRFAVADTGPGLLPDQVAHRFDRYHPAADPRHELHRCRRIVEAHRGRIGASSILGEGSTLWFTIPLEPELLA